jgi:hypothetical protein
MATKTAPKPPETLAAAQERLREAEENMEDVARRIVEGDATITAAQIGNAEDRVKLARLHLGAVEKAEAEAAEKARLARVDAIVKSLSAGDLRAKGTEILSLTSQAAELLQEAARLGDEIEDQLKEAAKRLYADQPLPDGVEVSGMSNYLSSARDVDHITVDGKMWSVRGAPLAFSVVSEAITPALIGRTQRGLVSAFQGVLKSSGRNLEALRRAVKTEETS